MGAWGPAIFSDDTACDVRDEYRRMVGEGLSGVDATDALLKQWGPMDAADSDAIAFWLGLAATQWKCGRLEPRVKAKALKLISSGACDEAWEDDKSRAKRRKAIEKLEGQLRSLQPAEKRIRKQFRDSCDWAVGEVIGYRLSSGNWCLFRVLGHQTDKGGTSPYCEVLDWSGQELPGAEAIAQMQVREFVPPHDTLMGRRHTEWRISIGATSAREKPVDRINRLGISAPPAQSADGISTVCLWRYLDDQLKTYYGLE